MRRKSLGRPVAVVEYRDGTVLDVLQSRAPML